METRLFSITGEIRPRKSAKRGKTWDRASFLRQSKAEGARAETDVFGNVETEASEGIIANGIRGNGLYGNKKRKEAGLGAIKADVVENLEIGKPITFLPDKLHPFDANITWQFIKYSAI